MGPLFKYYATGILIAMPLLASAAGDGRLTLEMLYHPNQKIDTKLKPLTRLSWDAQNRLIESAMNEGVLQQAMVDLQSWQKTQLGKENPVTAILRKAGIEEKQVIGIADKLGAEIRPGASSYLFTYQNDLWLLDLKAGLARELTHTPDQAEDEAILSPDAKSVAYLKGNDIYLTDIATARETRLTHDGSETNFNGRLDWVYMEEVYGRGKLRAFWWAPDSSKLAFLNFDESKVPVYTLPGEHVQPVRTERTRYPKAGDPNPVVRLGILDKTGKLSWTENPYPDQETLIVQVGWTPDGKLLSSWQNRVQTWLDLRMYDADLKKSKVMVRETSPAWVERLPFPVFLKDGGFLWESDRTGHRHIYRYQADYKLLGPVTKGEWDVRELHGVNEKSGEVYFSANERNPIGNDLYAAALDGKSMRRLTQEKGTHQIRWSGDFSHYIDIWSSLQHPPKQGVFSADGKLLKLTDETPIPAAVQALKLAKVSQQQVKARDGFLLESLLYLPPDFDPARKYPVYQHLYAGPMAPQVSDRWSNDLYPHFLAQQGYIVWVLDNRSASNKGAASAWGIHRNLGAGELQDQLDGLEWLRAKGWADMDRVALNGWSYGGYFTSYAMTHSKAWKIGFVGAPVTDWHLYDSIYTERYMGLPSENKEGYERSSVIKAASALSGKIMIMHGTMDDNVHPQNMVMLIDSLIKNDKEYSLQLYPGMGHGPRGAWEIWSLQKAKWKFLKENL